jgi:DNA repair protein SbcC/Rad50
MRPERLEVEGFSAFRGRTDVPFAGAELFALTGPTGSGKSSLIDAIVFALYGSVPRYGRRDVAPVVTQGMLQARVRLDFTVGGVPYTAVRVVRKDAHGKAGRAEARLESGDEVLAASPAEVTEAVTGLLGLDYEQFTTCVVLPQGEFERFLHARPSDRQGLLVALLDLGVYERVAQLATGRQRLAEGRAAEIEARLARLDATDEMVEAAGARAEALTSLLTVVEEAVPELGRVGEGVADVQRRLDGVVDGLGRLAETAAPPGFDDLAGRLAAARTALDGAGRAVEEREAAVTVAEAALGAERPRAELERALAGRHDLESERRRLDEARTGLAAADASVVSAASEEEAAEARVERARSGHAAIHLRAGLAVGEPCPVCDRVVDALPAARPVPGLEDAVRDLERAAAKRRTAEGGLAAITARVADLERRIETLAAGVAGEPEQEELEHGLDAVNTAETELAAARASLVEARSAAREASERHEVVRGEEGAARKALLDARDRLTPWAPPAFDLEDVAADWLSLLAWADRRRAELEVERQAIEAEAAALRRAFEELDGRLRDECRSRGVEPGGRPVRDAVVDALADARSRLTALTDAVEESRRIGGELDERRQDAIVAKGLAGYLKANNFEKWLLDEALHLLADGANRRLAELAGGQYSLALDARLEFEVIDHQAADERRSVRSLSGGETFLVSLALALSLADHVTEMAAAGTTKLEAIFLDEGFGSLDPDTLETVASVIAEIGASGKTVGLVTHVKELAELVPVRFEIRKGPAGATVERVES